MTHHFYIYWVYHVWFISISSIVFFVLKVTSFFSDWRNAAKTWLEISVYISWCQQNFHDLHGTTVIICWSSDFWLVTIYFYIFPNISVTTNHYHILGISLLYVFKKCLLSSNIFYFSHHIGNNHPHWLIFFRGVQANQSLTVCLS